LKDFSAIYLGALASWRFAREFLGAVAVQKITDWITFRSKRLRDFSIIYLGALASWRFAREFLGAVAVQKNTDWISSHESFP
jgi:hypothetical protein